MSNINVLLSYPSDLYFKAYSEHAAQVNYLSCSFRNVHWGLSLLLSHAYLIGRHPYYISVQNMWFLFQAASLLRRSKLKTDVSLCKRIKYFPSTQQRVNLDTQHWICVSVKLGQGNIIHGFISVWGELSKSIAYRPNGLVWAKGQTVKISCVFRFLRLSEEGFHTWHKWYSLIKDMRNSYIFKPQLTSNSFQLSLKTVFKLRGRFWCNYYHFRQFFSEDKSFWAPEMQFWAPKKMLRDISLDLFLNRVLKSAKRLLRKTWAEMKSN